MEKEIKAALVALLAGIKAADGRVIVDEMAKLDGCLARGLAAGGLHPQLVHFLENRSYVKALMFLGGETDIPVGACGGRAGQTVRTAADAGAANAGAAVVAEVAKETGTMAAVADGKS